MIWFFEGTALELTLFLRLVNGLKQFIKGSCNGHTTRNGRRSFGILIVLAKLAKPGSLLTAFDGQQHDGCGDAQATIELFMWVW